MPTALDAPRVAVVGGGLAGMAAAARLAKMGHRVRLYEARESLGGSWTAYELPAPGLPDQVLRVDDAPAVIVFPAPWRDLFRKSGRPLEAELARSGQALVPAPAATYRFADGTEVVLPTDRGGQQEALRTFVGPGPAARFQHLVDSLDDTWQALRPLGLEEAYDAAQVSRDVRRRLRSRRSLADLADALDDGRLRALVRSVAHLRGTTPERAPALVAVGLLTARTFGRWQVAPASAPAAADQGDVGRSSALVDALARRLVLRRVEVVTRTRVLGVEAGPTGPTGVRTAAGIEPAAAVVLSTDPWTAADLAPSAASRTLRRTLRGASAALAPAVTHELLDDDAAPDPVVETTHLDVAGVPVVISLRRLAGTTVRTTHDHRRSTPRPGAGVDTHGFRAWARRPGTSTGVPGVVLAGAASPAGSGAPAVLQSGALAAYAVAGRRD